MIETKPHRINKTNYLELLQDRKWFEKREEILKRDNRKCVLCQSNKNLIVHHRQYHWSQTKHGFVRPWEYKNQYLITLCVDCHSYGHKHFTISTKTLKA